VAALKTSNQELQQKVQDLTKSLTSCRQLLAEAEEKLDRKKELVRGKDEQLRRYLGVIQAMRRN
jgi:cell division septum initiation protein DivIVA